MGLGQAWHANVRIGLKILAANNLAYYDAKFTMAKKF